MRQYVILYKRGLGKESVRLNPAETKNLYDKPGVNDAVAYMAAHEECEGIYVRLDDECFQIIAFTQEALAPNAFSFQTNEAAEP